MGALNGWLKAVRADGLVLARTRVAGPWGFAVQPRNAVVFHFVAEGRAFVRQPDAETMALQAGAIELYRILLKTRATNSSNLESKSFRMGDWFDSW